MWAGHMDFGVVAGEFADSLAARSARRDQSLALAENENFRDPPFAGGDHGGDCAGLGACPDRIGGVFDIRA